MTILLYIAKSDSAFFFKAILGSLKGPRAMFWTLVNIYRKLGNTNPLISHIIFVTLCLELSVIFRYASI